MKWQIGDRVRVIDGSFVNGSTGTVCALQAETVVVKLYDEMLWEAQTYDLVALGETGEGSRAEAFLSEPFFVPARLRFHESNADDLTWRQFALLTHKPTRIRRAAR